ncbi:MAG: hypothetical protein JXR51_04805 [Bacteroidales bacterium]|nr:hypothetical protein [Bacteroidales bacterium]MBN2756478.1 hypothetical protein [Bacteroidales bacterium]
MKYTLNIFTLTLLSFLFFNSCTNDDNNNNNNEDPNSEAFKELYEKLDRIEKKNNETVKSIEEDKVKMEDCRHTDNYENCTETYISYDEVADSVKEAYNVVIKFLTWYNKNYKKLDQDKLVTYSDSCKYYIADKKHADFYIKTIESTNLVSEGFINSLKKEFKNFGDYFEKEKLDKDTDGPIGYEADIIYNSQDSPYYDDFSSSKLTDFTLYKDKIAVSGYPASYVTLVKNKQGNWLIEDL